MNASMDAKLAVSSVSTDSWETEAISGRMVGKESYRWGTASGLKHWLCRLMQGL